ncbi:MAG: NAD(P)H dehydrogenase assembly family protein [Cyanobium sp.]
MPEQPVSSSGHSDSGSEPAAFAIGENVQLAQRQPYLKTANPMPMLRPPDLIGEKEIGQVVEMRAQDQRAIRFRRGTFLIAADQLRAAQPNSDPG